MPMRVKLYLDVFFLINTGMNLVVFLTQSLLMQKTIRLWRLILASILGAVMACLLVLFHVHRNLLLLVGIKVAVGAKSNLNTHMAQAIRNNQIFDQ